MVSLLCLTTSLGFVFYLQSFTDNKKAKCVSYVAWCTPEPLLQHLLVCSSWYCCVHTPAATTALAFALEILVEESPESRVGLGEETRKGTSTEPGNRLSLGTVGMDLNCSWPREGPKYSSSPVAREQRESQQGAPERWPPGGSRTVSMVTGFYMNPFAKTASFLQAVDLEEQL